MTISLPIEGVEFVKELYPRLREDDAAIERYRSAIDRLPPITVARGNVLVDGFHRWQAHRREGVTEIQADDLGNISDAEIFNESIRRNASHGHQLAAKDKANLAGKLWQTLAHLPNAERVSEISDLLAVSERSVQSWTKDARKYEKEQQQANAWDLWLDCQEQQAIALAIGISEATVSSWFKERRSADSEPPSSRQHFDVWNFQSSTSDSSYFGHMPPQIVENLLWTYTQPGDIVFDPFAGGGTTIDVAKAMGRRVWASDRKPSTPTLPIHQHDITTGWPDDAPKKVDFILLDPPYWKQAAGRYSPDADDLGNMSLDDFRAAWDSVVKVCADHLSPEGKLAYIISPSVVGEELSDGSTKQGRRFDVVDHAFEMYQTCVDVGLQPRRRYIVTYNTQQATGQQVEWARENKQHLKLYRDLVVMQP